ncbi:MAG: hypothetical protein DRH08_04820 [Deltaproteobacteria bacterium]|nr:MAG: hypothetical protein DRH08_04820 [Deltaproteobacteria bacterium]
MSKLLKLVVNFLHRAFTFTNYLPARRIGVGRNIRVGIRKLQPPYFLTVIISDGCNLSCKNCNMAAPDMPMRFADPGIVLDSLRTLKKHYRPKTVYAQGGEGLLHPQLVETLTAIRRSRLSRHLTFLTNGILLNQTPAIFWDAINSLEISVYPRSGVDASYLERIKQRAKENQVTMVAYAIDSFRVSLTTRAILDQKLIWRIYRTCESAHLWGCHTIHGRYFFKCPQAIFAPQMSQSQATHDYTEDGILLDGKRDLYKRLYDYLDSDRPLKACSYCLGSVGILRPHELQTQEERTNDHSLPVEDLIDFEKLATLEKGFDRYVEARKRLV